MLIFQGVWPPFAAAKFNTYSREHGCEHGHGGMNLSLKGTNEQKVQYIDTCSIFLKTTFMFCRKLLVADFLEIGLKQFSRTSDEYRWVASNKLYRAISLNSMGVKSYSFWLLYYQSESWALKSAKRPPNLLVHFGCPESTSPYFERVPLVLQG